MKHFFAGYLSRGLIMNTIQQLASEYGLEAQIITQYDKKPKVLDHVPIILDVSALEYLEEEESVIESLTADHHVIEISTKLIDIYLSKKATKANLDYVQNMFEVTREKARTQITNGARLLKAYLEPLKQYFSVYQEINNHRFSVDSATLDLLKKHEQYPLVSLTKVKELIENSKDSLTTKPVRAKDIDIYYYYIWLRALPDNHHFAAEIDRVASQLTEFGDGVCHVLAKSLLTDTYDLDRIIKTTCRQDIWLYYVRILKESKKPYEGVIYGLVGARLQYYTTQPRPTDIYCLYPLAVNTFAMENISTFNGKKLVMICSVYRSSTAILPYLNKLSEKEYNDMLVLERELFD